MAYSGGSPGILGSLITFMVPKSQASLEFDAWKHWFETAGFTQYVQHNEIIFQPLSDEWVKLTQREWVDLTSALEKRKHDFDPVPLYLRTVSGDHDKAETRLKALMNGTTSITDGNNDHRSRSPTDEYIEMCQRIRGWYLRIIVERRWGAEDDVGTGCILIVRQVNNDQGTQ